MGYEEKNYHKSVIKRYNNNINQKIPEHNIGEMKMNEFDNIKKVSFENNNETDEKKPENQQPNQPNSSNESTSSSFTHTMFNPLVDHEINNILDNDIEQESENNSFVSPTTIFDEYEFENFEELDLEDNKPQTVSDEQTIIINDDFFNQLNFGKEDQITEANSKFVEEIVLDNEDNDLTNDLIEENLNFSSDENYKESSEVIDVKDIDEIANDSDYAEIDSNVDTNNESDNTIIDSFEVSQSEVKPHVNEEELNNAIIDDSAKELDAAYSTNEDNDQVKDNESSTANDNMENKKEYIIKNLGRPKTTAELLIEAKRKEKEQINNNVQQDSTELNITEKYEEVSIQEPKVVINPTTNVSDSSAKKSEENKDLSDKDKARIEWLRAIEKGTWSANKQNDIDNDTNSDFDIKISEEE